jgi:hypothetical protein
MFFQLSEKREKIYRKAALATLRQSRFRDDMKITRGW